MTKRAVQLLVFMALMTASLVLSAGCWDWLNGWLMIALNIAAMAMAV